MAAIYDRAEDRQGCAAVEEKSFRDFNRQARHVLVQPCVAFSTHLARSAQRLPARFDAVDERSEAGISAMSRRELSGRQFDRHAFPVEEYARRYFHPARAHGNLELSIERWHGLAGIFGMGGGYR